jgi:hypothetical protein
MAASQASQAMGQYQTQANLLGTGLQAGGTLGAMYYMKQPTGSTAQPSSNLPFRPTYNYLQPENIEQSQYAIRQNINNR